MALHLNKLEFQGCFELRHRPQAFSPKNNERITRGLPTMRLDGIGPVVLDRRERFSKVVRAYKLSPHGKGRRLLIKQT